MLLDRLVWIRQTNNGIWILENLEALFNCIEAALYAHSYIHSLDIHSMNGLQIHLMLQLAPIFIGNRFDQCHHLVTDLIDNKFDEMLEKHPIDGESEIDALSLFDEMLRNAN